MTREEFIGLNADEKKEAKIELWGSIKEACANDEDAVAALKCLRPTLFRVPGQKGGGGVSKTAKYTIFANMFPSVGDEADEVQVFTEMKIGRKEAKSLIKDIIKKSIVESRKWITFDPEAGTYSLVKIGAEAPSDWTGYIPVEVIEDDELL